MRIEPRRPPVTDPPMRHEDTPPPDSGGLSPPQDELLMARDVGEQLLEHARQVARSILGRVDLALGRTDGDSARTDAGSENSAGTNSRGGEILPQPAS